MSKALPVRNQGLFFGVPDYTEAEIEAVVRVMRSGWVGMGPETHAFENELALYTGAAHVVAVNSCTSALFLSLLVEGIKAGDEVIVPSLTWCSDANVVLQAGAVPVFCDVDAETMCVTPEAIAKQLTAKTRAVIVVHYGGYAVDVQRLRERLPSNVSIIEDAAHAIGAVYPNGLKVGGSGNPVCFSFYANKNLSTADGGAIAIADTKKADRLRVLRMNGMNTNAWASFTNPSISPEIQELGYKMNFTDLQAAIGRVQLARFEEMSKKRLDLVSCYLEVFSSRGFSISFQKDVTAPAHARHLLVGVFDSKITGMPRNDFLRILKQRKIGAGLHYLPLHQMKFFSSYSRGRLEVTEYLASRVMTLPVSAALARSDVAKAAEEIVSLVRKS